MHGDRGGQWVDLIKSCLDNPIIVKHARSRLRPQALGISIFVVLLLCILIAYYGYETKSFTNDGVFGTVLALQTVILAVMGAGQIGFAVVNARASGIMDFHRVSPMTPTALTLGFFFGAPIREYLLFLCTLPLAALCVAFESPPLVEFLQLMVALLAITWAVHGLVLVISLLSKAKATGGITAGLWLFFFFLATPMIQLGRFMVRDLDRNVVLPFFGFRLPWLLVGLLYVGAILVFFFVAARRKMASERLHALSKTQALASLFIGSILVLGAIWRQPDYDVFAIVALYFLVTVGVLLTLLVTPSLTEYNKGLWRANKMGVAHLSVWDDHSINRAFLMVACTVLLSVISVMWYAGSPVQGERLQLEIGQREFHLAAATGVFTVAYFGLALQFFKLRFGARANMYFGVFLFVVWVVPVIVGSILLFASYGPGASGETPGSIAYAINPLIGMALGATAKGSEGYRNAVLGAALTPALLFTFVFNSLLTSAVRRARLAVALISAKGKEPAASRVAAVLLVVVLAVPANAGSTLAEALPRLHEPAATDSVPAQPDGRRLYVAEPGIRDYVYLGGHGLLVFDIDHGHKFVRRIKTSGIGPMGYALNVKGICAAPATKRVYISTIKQIMALDLVSEKMLWDKPFTEGCDRMSITPDGAKIYLPSLEGPLWNVLSGDDGHVIARITPDSGSHNTVVGSNGKEAYLAGLKSPRLTVVDTATDRVLRTVGPFSASIRPFTVNGKQTLCFVNVNELLGFEVGDLVSGAKLARVEVSGYAKGPTKRHGCPSHGVALTPDETEVWIADAFNNSVHIFDATVMPPRQVASIKVREQPGWITFSIDGQYAYPSTGDVIDTRTRKIVAQLTDEQGRQAHSEKMMEIDFQGGVPVRVGDQFGLGRVGPPDGR